MRRANCADCGEDHEAEYKRAADTLGKRHKLFSVLFVACVSVAIVAGWFVAPGFGFWTAAVFGLYLSYVNLASIDQGRTLISRTLAEMDKAGAKPDDDGRPAGGQYL